MTGGSEKRPGCAAPSPWWPDKAPSSPAVAPSHSKAVAEREGFRSLLAGVSADRLIVSPGIEFARCDGEEIDAGPGFWLHMSPGTPHSLVADEPTVMLLTLVRP